MSGGKKEGISELQIALERKVRTRTVETHRQA
jgi:DNA-binding NarL/FixJ family response regulator